MADSLQSHISPLTRLETYLDSLPVWLASVPNISPDGSVPGLSQMILPATRTLDGEDDEKESYRHQQKQ